jgi:hypothetical protein
VKLLLNLWKETTSFGDDEKHETSFGDEKTSFRDESSYTMLKIDLHVSKVGGLLAHLPSPPFTLCR